MIAVKDQTVYKCEGCGRRFLSRSGVKEHERKYCRKHPNSEKCQDTCPHEKIFTSWTPISGEEHRMEPDYDYCANCGKRF